MKTLLFLFLLPSFVFSQNWEVAISSSVELKTWYLTSKAEVSNEPLQGATIKLMKDEGTIGQWTSGTNGSFTVRVPGGSIYTIEITYPGCNPKRFEVNTTGVPENIAADNFNPTFGIIGGFVMSKPFPGIDYSALSSPLVKVLYDPKIKNFNDDKIFTENNLGRVMKIAEAENILISNFCNTNKEGDIALKKPDCPLAKSLYEKAISIIPGEQYPVQQLAKVGKCFEAIAEKEKQKEQQKLAEEQAAKDKLEKERLAKEQAAAKKLADQEAAKAKAAQKQAAKEEKKKTTETPKKVEEKKPVSPAKKDEIVKQQTQPSSTNPPSSGSSGQTKHRVRQELGGGTYKEHITKANELFFSGKYTEAKKSYENALKYKPGDAYANGKIKEISGLIGNKP